MGPGHGDQNSEKHLNKKIGINQKKKLFKNIKIWEYGVFLTNDRNYDTFDWKKYNKTLQWRSNL